MNEKRFSNAKAAVAFVIVSLLIVPSAFAQTSQIRTPVSFTLSGCSMLPPGLTIYGSGESFMVVNSRIDSNGTAHIEQNNLVVGTATDSNGAVYSFNYHNHASMEIPASGFPFSFQTTDHFNLVGNGQANQFQVHFVARGTFFSPTSFTVEFVNTHG